MSAAPPMTATRREQLLAQAARLFSQRGFHGVSLDELGAGAGISGPAVYKHFPNKVAVLSELLVGISERLLADARRITDSYPDPDQALEQLLGAHVAFALSRPELILIQDRDLASLPPEEERQVRRLQRDYVEIWVDVLRRRRGLAAADARTCAHAVFGLLNSTPYSSRSNGRRRSADLLLTMARAALA